MGALARLAGRVRAKPWIAVAIVAGTLLVAAWLGWTIYVASDRGANEGIGVLIAWPALLLAVALIALPFAGIYSLIRWLSRESGGEKQQQGDQGTPAEADEPQTSESS